MTPTATPVSAPKTATGSRSVTRVVPAVLAAFLGLAVVFIAGHAQSGALHQAAHDVRHSTGFPCH
ncbi:MAG: CbtB-domain containing protein [Alphaproteobacteria bacterium]|nr:CbtB-domain containing protein [Alphaproteobacteria bacterium]